VRRGLGSGWLSGPPAGWRRAWVNAWDRGEDAAAVEGGVGCGRRRGSGEGGGGGGR
jgi:hypothetical protein